MDENAFPQPSTSQDPLIQKEITSKAIMSIKTEIEPTFEFVEVKTEPPEIVQQESIEIKDEPIEEPLPDFIIEKNLTICSFCQTLFERNNNNKITSSLESNKCNTCILHSRLNQAFNRPTKPEITPKNFTKTTTVRMIVCQACGRPFERNHSRDASERLKCNKCILHTKLNAIISRPARRKPPKKHT